MDVLSRQKHCAWRRAAPWVLAAVLLGAGAGRCPPLRAQGEGPAEYQVKAAFLLNFTKFVDWPETSFADARAPIVVGIVGENPFGEDLDKIVGGQMVKGRSIRIVRFKFGDDLRNAHVVFVSASEGRHVPQILASLQGTDVLTVSDIEGFAKAGGMMQLVTEESRVRFLVNRDAAAHTRLRINSKLLALARIVSRSDP